MSDSPASARLKATVAPAEVPGIVQLLTLAVAVVVVAALFLAREVLIPITLAVLLSFVLAPLVALLRRTGLPRAPSVLLTVLLALALVLALGGIIGTQVAQLTDEIPRYADTIQKKVQVLRGYTLERVSGISKNMTRQIEPPAEPAPVSPEARPSPTAPVPVEVHQPEPTPLQMMESFLTPLIAPLATMALVFVVTVFVLLQKEDLRDRLIRLFGSRDLHRTTAAMDDAAERLSKYFLAQLALNASFGLVIMAGLFLIGVPNPILWGIIAALMRFVPYVGVFVSAGLPMALAAAVDPGWSMVIATAGLFLVLEPLVGQVIEPMVYGRSTGLTPVSVVISAIFWGWLWGPVGLILSMPLTLCLVVLGRHIERMEFLNVLLGDQPALTPAESFYQRLLAGDADEALDQAEGLVRDTSLSAYYDEVAVAGLQLAANDSLRGVLTAEQLSRILDAISGVVVDLADQSDGVPPEGLDPAWTEEAAVLCVSGRGPLDEAACSMLAQILGKRGLRARVVSNAAVSRLNVASLDVTGVRWVVVSYLEGGNSVSPLRYLMRRLRQRMPGVTTVVGFWQGDRALLADERIKTAVGADLYVTSLREAAELCVEAARQRLPVPELAAPVSSPHMIVSAV